MYRSAKYLTGTIGGGDTTASVLVARSMLRARRGAVFVPNAAAALISMAMRNSVYRVRGASLRTVRLQSAGQECCMTLFTSSNLPWLLVEQD